MKVFLAATSSRESMGKELLEIPYILESFYSINNKKTLERVKKHNKEKFLLDSGAFTFMNNFKGKVNFNEYLEKYINFINEYNVKYFFELDIDSVVGYEKVKELRKKLEINTQKKCIPVWHKSRGLEEWKKLTKEYDYVAIGGIVIKEIKPADYKYFIPLLKIAKENNCKVHGLGFTNTSKLHKYNFYSVDSTNWLSGGRFGQLHIFNGKYMESKSFKNKRAKDYKKIDSHNLREWIKFQNYADKYL